MAEPQVFVTCEHSDESYTSGSLTGVMRNPEFDFEFHSRCPNVAPNTFARKRHGPFDPDLTVIGGGLSQVGAMLFNGMRAEALLRMINPFAADTPIVPAKLASYVGMLSAASKVQQATQ